MVHQLPSPLPSDLEATLSPNFASFLSELSIRENSNTAYSTGQTIVHMMGLGQRAFVVTRGEVAIYVNDRLVDLIEAGEYFDESIWLGGEAIALTDCQLRTVTELQPALIQH